MSQKTVSEAKQATFSRSRQPSVTPKAYNLVRAPSVSAKVNDRFDSVNPFESRLGVARSVQAQLTSSNLIREKSAASINPYSKVATITSLSNLDKNKVLSNTPTRSRVHRSTVRGLSNMPAKLVQAKNIADLSEVIQSDTTKPKLTTKTKSSISNSKTLISETSLVQSKVTTKNKEFIITHSKRPSALVHQSTASSSDLKESVVTIPRPSSSEDSNDSDPTQDNFSVELSHPCLDFISVLSSSLAKLDYRLSNESPSEIQDSAELRKLKRMYKKFTSKFLKVGQIQNSVFVYSLVLAKKVQKIVAEKFAFGPGEMMLLYSGCFLLSIKMVLDTEKWFVEDFALVSGMDKPTISKIELFLMEECLDFYAGISEEEYKKEHLSLYRKTDKRKNKRAE